MFYFKKEIYFNNEEQRIFLWYIIFQRISSNVYCLLKRKSLKRKGNGKINSMTIIQTKWKKQIESKLSLNCRKISKSKNLIKIVYITRSINSCPLDNCK